MLFHAFRVVYTVKELDSHAKHGQSLKKKVWMYNRVFLCQKSHFRIRTSFGEFFSIVVLDDVNDGGTPYMGISPRRTHPCTHRPEWERERAHQRASIGRLAARTRSGRMSLKKCVFGCEGKITLFSFPKQPTVTWTVDIVCFSGAAMEFLKCFVDERFINKAQFDAGFAHRLILKDGAVPAIKDPGHDSELQMVSETASNVSVLLAIGASARHSLAPPTRHASRSSAFFGENRKSVSFFYKYDKTKDFLEIWRMQYYSIGTQD